MRDMTGGSEQCTINKIGKICFTSAAARAPTDLNPFSQNSLAVRLLTYVTPVKLNRSDLAPTLCEFRWCCLKGVAYQLSIDQKNGRELQIELPSPSSDRT